MHPRDTCDSPAKVGTDPELPSSDYLQPPCRHLHRAGHEASSDVGHTTNRLPPDFGGDTLTVELRPVVTGQRLVRHVPAMGLKEFELIV